MSVVILEKNGPDRAGPSSGGAMDRVVERKRIDRRLLAALALVGAAILLLAFLRFAPNASSQTIAADRVSVGQVTSGVFEDFLPLRAGVTPLVTVYLDAVEGGRVDELFVEDGAAVSKGQLLARLSNADLQLSTLARQTEVAQQLNNMRSQELALAQSRLANERALIEADHDRRKAQRSYDVQQPLATRGFIAGKTFRDTADDLAYQQHRAEVLRRGNATDERLQSSQLAELRASAASLQTSLGIARGSLDALNLRAPVSGTLSAFSIQLGQSMQKGERLGQIDSPGRNKLVAGIDEFYLSRVAVGQSATLDQGGRTYQLRVAKVYPQVRNGQFEVDLTFIGPEPAGIQRGQTLQAKLTLGDARKTALIPFGSYYNDTGGAWVFVVSPDRAHAERRGVKLGRKNLDFVEVLSGLQPGERIITSSYAGFTDKRRLDLERPAN
ncbi:MAG: efflux RND transporter periplasmic adaptor subunit [Sphingomicrobium sp.]|nr:efflux RND transporter periplasmic adaptor subunit [Sphingomonadales bacterium]